MEEELSNAELNALSPEGLRVLEEGGSLEDLPVNDLKTIEDMNTQKPSWFQENIAQPVMEKLGDIYGAATNLSSQNIRQEALNKMIAEGTITPEEASAGLVEPGIGDKALIAGERFLQDAFESLRTTEGETAEDIKSKANPEILADMMAMDVQGASLGAMNAVALAKGQAYTMTDSSAGILEKAGNILTAGEQAVARGTLTALASIGVLDRDQAIEMLSQTQVHGSDLVDHFWIPKTAYGKIGRGIVGFAADVAMDPLSYLTFGAGPALRKAAQTGALKVGNRVVTNPSMLSRMERQALLAQDEVLQIVRKDGTISKMAATDDAVETMAKAINDNGLAGLDGELVKKFNDIDPALGQQVKQIFESRQQTKGFVRSIADGDTSLNFAFRLPFQRTAIEFEVPLFGRGTRWAAEGAIGVKDWAVDSISRVVGDLASRSQSVKFGLEKGSELADTLGNAYQAFKTFTTRPLWDVSSNKFINRRYGNGLWARREMDEAIKEVGNDPEDARLMVQWLNQSPTFSDEDLIKRFIPDGGYEPIGMKEPIEVFHGSNTAFAELSFDKSGGMVFFAENPDDALQYAMDTGSGGRRALSKADVNFFEYDGSEVRFDQGKNKFVTKSGEEFSESAFQSGISDGTFYVEPKQANIRKQIVDKSRLLDITSESGVKKFLDVVGDSADPVVSRLVVAASDQLNKIPGARGLSNAFWSTTKLSRGGEISSSLKSLTQRLKDAGYSGIRFNDDSHKSIAAFDNAIEYTPIKKSKGLELKIRAKGDLVQARKMADQTMAQLQMRNPKAAARVRKIREQFADRIAEMKKRNIPFEVLNPFDETIPVEQRAMGYFPHIMNPDYIDELGRPKYAAAREAFTDHIVELGLADKTQVGRRDRRSTQTIIDSVRQASGIKDPIFINDPISASYSRMEDMDNLIAQHDMFKEIWPLAKIQSNAKLDGIGGSWARLAEQVSEEIPERGWIKFDPSEFSTPVMKKYGKAATVEAENLATNLTEKEFLQFSAFIPDEYKLAIKNGGKIYFPEDVANRIQYLMQREKGGVARSALDAFNYMFRNSALFGTGYQGMNALSNLTTYMTARADLSQIARASKFLFDARNNNAKVRDQIFTFGSGANQIRMSGEELYNLAASRGVLSNSMVSEADIVTDVWENIATTKSVREKFWNKSRNFYDKWTGFKLNRFAAEANDNMFRLGLFMDSLEKGYTINGAKERLDMFFYDFRDVPAGQRAMSQVIPFSSFGVKSVESLAARAKNLDFKAITLPYYASEVMEGAYVDSYETRQYLKANLPTYADHQIFGAALPGNQQLMVELPFMVNSIKMFLNPFESAHPLIAALSMAEMAVGQGQSPDDFDYDAAQMDSDLMKDQKLKLIVDTMHSLIPPTIKMPITLAQMQNPDEVRSLPLDFVKRYKPGMIEMANTDEQALTAQNAIEFGKYVSNQYPDFVYNLLMYGRMDAPILRDEEEGDAKRAMFGRLVKSQIRNISLGTTRMQDMDRAILTRLAAIRRQITKTEKAISQINVEAEILRDPMAKPKLKLALRGRADEKTDQYSAELVELNRRAAALEGFYGYYLMDQKQNEGLVFQMLKDAIAPEKELTQEQIDQENVLNEMAPDMIPGRVKKIEMDMLNQIRASEGQ